MAVNNKKPIFFLGRNGTFNYFCKIKQILYKQLHKFRRIVKRAAQSKAYLFNHTPKYAQTRSGV